MSTLSPIITDENFSTLTHILARRGNNSSQDYIEGITNKITHDIIHVKGDQKEEKRKEFKAGSPPLEAQEPVIYLRFA